MDGSGGALPYRWLIDVHSSQQDLHVYALQKHEQRLTRSSARARAAGAGPPLPEVRLYEH